MDGNATHSDKKQEEDELSLAHAEFELPWQRGHACGDVPRQLDEQCCEPPTWAGDIYLEREQVCGCKNFASEWNDPGEINKVRRDLRIKPQVIINI